MTVSATSCGFECGLEEVKYLFKFIFSLLCSGVEQGAVLSSTTEQAMSPEFGGKWETECLNTKSPLPSLLCAGLLNIYN